MTITEAMFIRRSRRSYLGLPLDEDEAQRLSRSAALYNEKAGLNIRLVRDGRSAFGGFIRSYGFFTGVVSYLAMEGPKDDPDLQEKLGYFGELMVLEATATGLGTCWVGETFDARTCSPAEESGLAQHGVITVGKTKDTLTLREKTIHAASHARSTDRKALYEADVPPPDWFLRGIEAADTAPSAQNRKPVRFFYRKGIVTAVVSDTKGFKLIDLGIAKLHFELGAGKGRWDTGNGGRYIIEGI